MTTTAFTAALVSGRQADLLLQADHARLVRAVRGTMRRPLRPGWIPKLSAHATRPGLARPTVAPAN
jgi:hypothetical protein